MPRSVVAALLLLVLVAVRPSPVAAGKDGFDDFVAVVGGRAAAGTRWLAGCNLLITPAGEVRRPCNLALVDLVTDPTGVTLEVTRNEVADLHHSQYQARDATVEARAGGKVVATFRVVEISGLGNPDSPTGGWDPIAVHWMQLVTDKQARARAKAGTLRTPPALADAVVVPTGDDQNASDSERLVDDLERALRTEPALRDRLAEWLADGVIVFGSAPGQKLTGKKGARTVRGWKLDLVQRGGTVRWADDMLGVAITDIVGATRGKVRTTFTYRSMVVFTQGLTDAGSLISGPRLVTFALPR